MAAIEFITQYDAEPEFWQFLNGLNYEDIITELIQNDLDAGATHTCITFNSRGFLLRRERHADRSGRLETPRVCPRCRRQGSAQALSYRRKEPWLEDVFHAGQRN